VDEVGEKIYIVREEEEMWGTGAQFSLLPAGRVSTRSA